MTLLFTAMRRRPSVAAAVLLLFAPGAADAKEAGGALSLTEARWVGPQTDLLEFLSETPGECLAAPEDADAAYLVEAGRAAFKSPLLFGGPAARGGLSCNSCHRDGHDNPAFFLAGLSGDPGTADVTSSLFSKTRDDGAFNPLPIPSLVGAGARAQFGTRDPKPTLHDFVAAAVVDEFQGAPPPPMLVDAVAAYVAHLREGACPKAPVPQSADRAMADAARAMSAAQTALERGDGAAADFLLVSAQRAIGVVHERFAAPDLADARASLVALSRALADIRPLTASRDGRALAALSEAQAAMTGAARLVHKRRKKSLYELKVLRRALEDGAGAPPRP